MEEKKTETIQYCMKYYCRVCTTNTRNKKSKPDESIGIFKRAGLRSFLEKYLHLQVSEDDPLPKVICKVCYDKIENIEFLRVIARRTETLLKDFLKNQDTQLGAHNQFQNEYNTFAISKSTERSPPKQEEVVVNVSLSDPLTKDIDKKLLVAQRKRESLEKAFTPTQISRSAVTSSPNVPPVTIVHQMPRKKQPHANLVEKRKKLQMALSNATTVTLENPPPVSVSSVIKLPGRPKQATAPPPPLRHISEAPAMPQKIEIHPVITDSTHALGHGVTLGSIIKDEDLLRLILKALKWPVNSQTLDLQIQRLKNTNFSDVIVDPNLLQDTDLIQILGPLIHPTLVPIPLAPPHQTYHISIPPEPSSLPPSTISYKLPAETSVQIITVPPEERSAPPKAPAAKSSTSNARSVIRKRQRHAPGPQKRLHSAVIVVSDESEDDSLKGLVANEEIQRFEVQLDPAMYPGVGDNSNSNEAMLATLNRQREAMMKVHRHKRKQTLMGANVEMVDDIMIVDEGVQMNESYPEVVLVKKPRRSHIVATTAASTSGVKSSTSTTSGAPLLKKMFAPSPTPQQPQSLPKLPKLTPLPVKKLPTIAPAIKKLAPTESKTAPKMPTKSDMSPPSPPQPACPLHNPSSTTLADADSTTKIVIKESKVPRQHKPSQDIEEQIVKVRIGKQTQKSTSPGKQGKNGETSSDEEVVIVVEYEGEAEERPKEPEATKEILRPVKEETVSQAKPEDIIEKEVEPAPAVDVVPPIQESPKSALEIKEEEQEDNAAHETTEPPQEEEKEKPKSSDEKKEIVERKPETHRLVRSSVARLTRSRQKQKVVSPKKPSPQKTVVTSYRPARKSKTLSKYYKGPPAESAGRSMRSRT